MGRTLAIKQYIAMVERLAPELDIRWERAFWPYPQAGQSRLRVYLGDDPQADAMDTGAHVWGIAVVNTDVRGALIRMAPGASSPSDLVALLRQRAMEIAR